MPQETQTTTEAHPWRGSLGPWKCILLFYYCSMRAAQYLAPSFTLYGVYIQCVAYVYHHKN
jgi:hypothetical protein